MTIVARLFVADPEERRFSQRRRVGADATLRTAKAVPHDVVVQDLSTTGCRFTSDDAFSDGTRVSIGIAGVGVHRAQILRRDGRLHGCEFVHALTPAQVEMAGHAQTVHRDVFVMHDASGFPEPSVGHYPGTMRVGIALGGAVVAWAAVGLAAAAIL